MLSAASRSSYICLQCRSRILQNVRPRPLRQHLVSVSHKTFSSSATRRRPAESQEVASEDSDEMAHLVSNFMQSAFGTSPPRPAPGIGKITRDVVSDRTLPDTWKAVGLRPVVADALARAYPSASRPTTIQKRILMGLSGGNSVAVRYLPGTGKSFAIAAWALGLERAMRRGVDCESPETWIPTTTAFIFVPTADLGLQYYALIQRILQGSSSEAVKSSIHSIVQFMCRRSEESEEAEQIRLLSEYPSPHIVIATPAIALDMLAHKDDKVRSLLDFTEVRAVIVDEIDAAITKVHYLATLRGQKVGKGRYADRVTETPIETLLNYIFMRRKADEMRRKRAAVQPQLVLPTATLSTSQIYKFITKDHPDWLGQPDPRSVQDIGPFKTSKAANLLPIGDENSKMDKIVRAVADNIRHHAVAYDIGSGLMRDAPVPRMEGWQDTDIIGKLNEMRGYEISNAVSRGRAREIKKHGNGGYDVAVGDMEELLSKRMGYPPGIAVDAIKKLLEHDNWPKNVIAAIGAEAGMRLFLDKCAEAGIDARELKLEDWNQKAEEEGRLPIGRTDMLFDPKVRERLRNQSENASMGKTTVWVSSAPALRGIDVPGIYHLYILHRLLKARDYTTYCGRVARWPFPSLYDEIRDPRAAGSQRRRGVGKVVSLLLEDHVVPASGITGKSDFGVITNDGSEKSKWAWLEEGLTLAKIGCFVQDYYGESGKYPCGPEVSLLESRPQPRPRAPLDNPFSILDSAFGSPKEPAKSPTDEPTLGLSRVSRHQPAPGGGPPEFLGDSKSIFGAGSDFPEELATEPARDSPEVALNQPPPEKRPKKSSNDPLSTFNATFSLAEEPTMEPTARSPDASLLQLPSEGSPSESSDDPLGIFGAVFGPAEEPTTEPKRESSEAPLRQPGANEGSLSSWAEPLSFADIAALSPWADEVAAEVATTPPLEVWQVEQQGLIEDGNGSVKEEEATEIATGPPLETGQVEQQGLLEGGNGSAKEGKGEKEKEREMKKPEKKAKRKPEKKTKKKSEKTAKPKNTENKESKKEKNYREKSTREAKKGE